MQPVCPRIEIGVSDCDRVIAIVGDGGEIPLCETHYPPVEDIYGWIKNHRVSP